MLARDCTSTSMEEDNNQQRHNVNGINEVVDEHKLQPDAELTLSTAFSVVANEDNVRNHLVQRDEEEEGVYNYTLVDSFAYLKSEVVTNRYPVLLGGGKKEEGRKEEGGDGGGGGG